jgi:hypothetical protein
VIAFDPALGWTARGALAGVLAQAAWHKARDLQAFTAALAAYEILPATLAPLAASQLLAAEIALAGLLLVPALRLPAALAAGALLLLYSAAIAANLARGRRHIDCGCAGPALRQPLSLWLLARNGALVALALVAALPPSGRALGALDALTIAGGAGILLATYSAANVLAAHAHALAPRPRQS